jgi:hypothetical protein
MWIGRIDGMGEQNGLQFSLIPLAILLGLLGTLLDSLLGATCQYTGYSPQLGKVRPPPGTASQHICGIPLSINLYGSYGPLPALYSGFAPDCPVRSNEQD